GRKEVQLLAGKGQSGGQRSGTENRSLSRVKHVRAVRLLLVLSGQLRRVLAASEAARLELAEVLVVQVHVDDVDAIGAGHCEHCIVDSWDVELRATAQEVPGHEQA